MAQSSDAMQRKLAEHKARLLMMACAEIAKTWPACGWILRLFETIFSNLGKQQHIRNDLSQPSNETPFRRQPDLDQNLSVRSMQVPLDKVRGEREYLLPSYQDENPSDMISERAGISTTSLHPDFSMREQFLNVPDPFDLDLLNGLPHDFSSDHDLLSYLMES
jgi:hypothetical protein